MSTIILTKATVYIFMVIQYITQNVYIYSIENCNRKLDLFDFSKEAAPLHASLALHHERCRRAGLIISSENRQ